VILFELITGQLPFRADNFMGLLNKHMFEAPPRPAERLPERRIPAEVEAIVLKALQKDPALRFQSMAEFAARDRRRHRRRPGRRRRRAAARSPPSPPA
jgi:serine/threonine protein kinase